MVVAQATRQLTTSRFLDHLHGPDRPVLVFDGATGTSLQDLGCLLYTSDAADE